VKKLFHSSTFTSSIDNLQTVDDASTEQYLADCMNGVHIILQLIFCYDTPPSLTNKCIQRKLLTTHSAKTTSDGKRS